MKLESTEGLTPLELIRLLDERVHISRCRCPQDMDSVGEGECTVGELTDTEKRLYLLRQCLGEAAEAAGKKSFKRGLRGFIDNLFRQSEVSPAAIVLHRDVEEVRLVTLAKLVDALLWAQLRSRLDLWGASSIGIRERWKVVTISVRDCGCGWGAECDLVKKGLITPEPATSPSDEIN